MVPRIIDTKVIPIANYGSMLLSLSGTHGSYSTRDLFLMTTDNGEIGAGEVLEGRNIQKVLEDAKQLLIGKTIGKYKNMLRRVHHDFNHLDNSGRGLRTYGLRTAVHAVTVIESAFPDLLGRFFQVPVAALLGNGQQGDEVDVLGYLFYVAGFRQTTLPYLLSGDESDGWGRLRGGEALTFDSIVSLAKAAYERYGFRDLKLKGGVLEGKGEIKMICTLKEAFSNPRITLGPNDAWSLQETIDLCEGINGVLSYTEDPCEAENGLLGRKVLARLRKATGLSTATNMTVTDWRQMQRSVALQSASIPLANPHFWTMDGSARVAQTCRDSELIWGSHSNNHLDISLAVFTYVATTVPGKTTAIDTH